jgi:hypothetical protein
MRERGGENIKGGESRNDNSDCVLPQLLGKVDSLSLVQLSSSFVIYFKNIFFIKSQLSSLLILLS